jgi:membrane dipeptidase
MTNQMWWLAGLLAVVTNALSAQADDAALRRAKAILRRSPVLDSHNDLPWVIREKGKPPRNVEGYDIAVRAKFDTDLPRLRQGMVGTQIWSVYVPSALPPVEAIRAQMEQIDIARRLIAKYPRDLALVTDAAGIRRAQAEGRIGSLIGMEGGTPIVNSLGALRAFYQLGVRSMTLTHYQNTDWADAATDSVRHNGLSPFGEEVVREMNRLGMLVDISHVAPATMSDALTVSEAPVIFSHSGARAVTDHVRNVPDSILRRLPANGGVVMVAAAVPQFMSESVRRWAAEGFARFTQAASDSQFQRITRERSSASGPPPRATVADVADHIDHIRKVAGIDHVGIGADFWGAEDTTALTKGLEDVSAYPVLFAELIRRGWTEPELRKLARENFIRAFSRAEAVAARLRRSRAPSLMTFSASNRAADYQVIDLMPRFWAVWDSTAGAPAAERTRAVRAQVIAPNAGFYRQVIGDPDDRRLEKYLTDIAPLAPAIRRSGAQLVQAIGPVWDQLRGLFPDLTPGVRIFVAPSLYTSNGQVRYLDYSLNDMLGPDVQAYVEEEVDSGRPLDPSWGIRHELVHYHHERVNPEIAAAARTFFQPGAHSALYYNLWSEGLATYVTKLLSPNVPLKEVLGPGLDPIEGQRLLPVLAREFLAKMESTSETDLKDLFYLASDRRADLPARSAYYVGFRVAQALAERYSLTELIRLSGTPLREAIREVLAGWAGR